jgi:formylglycine-generating enzyme required for sulfatase activity/WD40 repeat protein
MPSRVFFLVTLLGCCLAWSMPATSHAQDSIGIEMVLIPAGSFVMGNSNDDSGEVRQLPQREVTLSTPFYLSAHEITNEQFDRVVNNRVRYDKPGHPKAAVNFIGWEQAAKFCELLSELPESKAAGKVYRLPTEAEWEYACRAGSTSKYCYGNSVESLGDYAWYRGNSTDRQTEFPRRVGMLKPNSWGLYDMHGNVSEFCQDIFAAYPEGPSTDPRGPKDGYTRVIRGGNYGSDANSCRSAAREQTTGLSNTVGFRVAMNLASQIAPIKQVQRVELASFNLPHEIDHQSRSGPILPLRTLDYATLKESIWSMAALLANGADPNSLSNTGSPILFRAIDHVKAEIDIIVSNQNLDDQSREIRNLPPLDRDEPISKVLDALLESGADPNLCDRDGQSPLHYAITKQNWAAVKMLYAYGADPHKPDGSGLSAVELAKQRSSKNTSEEYLVNLFPYPPRQPKTGKRLEPPHVVRTPDQLFGTTRFRPATGGTAITFSSDGKQIICGQGEHVLRVFDADTGSRISAINIRTDYVSNHYIWSLTAIPNSRIVAASGGIGTPLRFWNIDSGTEVMRLACNSAHASVSPDGKFLFTGDYLCPIESSEPLRLSKQAREFRGKFDTKIQVRSSFFTPDSQYLILLDDEYVRAWNLENDDVVTLSGMAPKTTQSMKWADLSNAIQGRWNHPSQDLLAVRGPAIGFLVGNHDVLTSCLPLMSELNKKRFHRAFALSSDHRRLAALGWSSRIDVVDLITNKETPEDSGHTEALLAVAASPDGKWIASGGHDKQVILWDAKTDSKVRSIPLPSAVNALCFSADGLSLAIGAEDGTHVHQIGSGSTSRWASKGRVTGLQYDETSKAFLILCDQLEMRLARDGRLLASVPPGTAKAGKIAVGKNGIVVGSFMSNRERSQSSSAWSIEKNQLVPTPDIFKRQNSSPPEFGPSTVIALSQDGKYMARSQRMGELLLWDMEKNQSIAGSSTAFRGCSRRILDIEFSPDSTYLAAGCEDGTARVWEVSSGRQLWVFDADVHRIADIAFSPDGRLITANNDGTVHVWNVAMPQLNP